MDLDSTFILNEPDVLAESVEGETLIINLNSGVYYSSAGVGDEIWRYLRAGYSVAQIVELIGRRYAGDTNAIRADVLAFMAELREEELIVETEVPSSNEAPAPEAGDIAPFVPPTLLRYTDYQELLLLDPIHDVHELSGWPVRPDTSS